ncbi:AraC family transcriptional regulator [Gorillibacterium timonense]|uniref:AraC family transcriptional regulator n=1 Tax=Gorillibacterium timonense TaxID=1689269 RepID=UPI00071CE618|nr:AraC family transcriptional regulator [Gorillibacterium timonense]
MERCTVLPRQSHAPVDLHFYYYGSERCSPGASWGPAVKDHYKIFYIHSGQGVFRCLGEVYPLTAGQGFLVCPGVVFSYEADEANPWVQSWVAFHGTYTEAYLALAGLSAANPVFNAGTDTQLPSCFRQVRDADYPGESRELRITSAFFQLMATLLDEASGERSGSRPPESRRKIYAARAMEYVDVNYSRGVTVEELAADLGLSRKYLSRLFKDETGISPQQYLLKYRLDKASELLRGTALSVKEVSFSVGYKDPLLFSRMFKQLFGLSPRQYRESFVPLADA